MKRFRRPLNLGFVGGLESNPFLEKLLSDWNNLLPVAGLAVLAGTLVVFWLRRKPKLPMISNINVALTSIREDESSKDRCCEIVDHSRAGNSGQQNGDKKRIGRHAGFFPNKRPSFALPNGPQKLLYYTYAISGVTYETAQDITGLEERLHLSRVARPARRIA